MKRFVFFLIIIGFSLQIKAQIDPNVVQTDFLLGFARLMEWQSYDDETVVIDVLGNDKITKRINKLANNNLVGGRKFVAKNIDASNPINCNIIFIGEKKSNSLADVLQKTLNKSVLIVTERQGLTTMGADVSFARHYTAVGDSSYTYTYNKSTINAKRIKAAIEFYGYGKQVE